MEQTKLIYNDREHIGSCLGPERGGTYYNGAQGTFRADRNCLYFDYGGIYSVVFIYQDSKLYS